MDQEEEGIENFTKKIKSLKHVAIDLTELIKTQNKKIKDLEPEFNSSYLRLKSTMQQITKADFRRFRGWLYYILASIILFLLLFVFYFVF